MHRGSKKPAQPSTLLDTHARSQPSKEGIDDKQAQASKRNGNWQATRQAAGRHRSRRNRHNDERPSLFENVHIKGKNHNTQPHFDTHRHTQWWQRLLTDRIVSSSVASICRSVVLTGLLDVHSFAVFSGSLCLALSLIYTLCRVCHFLVPTKLTRPPLHATLQCISRVQAFFLRSVVSAAALRPPGSLGR